jgi:phosphatidylethanolamine/phosphatidyl-N-methylethanolamine N-methyltransferase
VLMKGFFKQFLLNYKNTGAISASSERLGSQFIRSSDLPEAKSVVELGSGSGVLTRKILDNLSPEADFFAMEVNPVFLKETKKRCPEAKVYQDSAHHLRQYVNDHNWSGIDCVISGLPWSLFKPRFQEILLEEILHSLNPGGEFLTFAYIHGLYLPSGRIYRKKLPGKFSKVHHSRIVWKNTPPALVYRAKKL